MTTRPEGTRYEAEVPDTLDLAERARAGVNVLTEIVRGTASNQPNQCGRYYRSPQVFSASPGGFVFVDGNEMWGKAAEALVEMRHASGSMQGADLDEKTFEGMVSRIEEDDLFYSVVKEIDGAKLVEAEDFACLMGGARVMLALIAKFQLDADPRWIIYLARLAKGFRDVAIFKDDYAYYPGGHSGGAISRPRSGWTKTDEPAGTSFHEDPSWYENSADVAFSLGTIVHALSRWYLLSGDKESLDLAGRLARFMLKPRFWRPEADPQAVVSAQHAHFEGHVHATVRGLWGLLEYATVVNDEQIKAFVRDGYEYVRTFGIARLGLFGEGCTVGDMTCLAIKLTDAGVGDYWEDVDQYVRNHLTEIQILDPEPVRRVGEISPAKEVMSWEDAERVAERSVGAICDDATHPTTASLGSMFCCTYNGLIGYFHAWNGIVRATQDGVAQVNLLLNRASPWLDVDSYLPYEGKVVIRNKTAGKISVRVPRWVDRKAVDSFIDDEKAAAYWLSRNLVFDEIAAGQTITITFPVVESAETYRIGWEGIQIPGWTEVSLPLPSESMPAGQFEATTSHGQNRPSELTAFRCHFRGNTLVDIHPREDGLGYPLYRREHYKEAKAPMRKVVRYVAPSQLDV